MVRYGKDMEKTLRPQMRGGNGTVILTQILKPDEMMGHGRMFSLVTLEPGCSVGEHIHTDEAELFYVVAGTLKGNDNGTEVTLRPGDMMLTGHGHSHAIVNEGAETAQIVACILSGPEPF